MSGLFITLEGIDGSGKSTQARLLAEWLTDQGRRVCATREPGGSEPGEKIRELLLSPRRSIPAEAELFLYLADRAIHVSAVVRPALEEGCIVVCERHADSTLAYQGYGRGLDLDLLGRLNAMAVGSLVPDLSIVLDIAPDEARLDASRLDRLESEGRDFMARVADGFRKLARAEPERVKLVNAAADVEAVQHEISALVGRLLERRQSPGARG